MLTCRLLYSNILYCWRNSHVTVWRPAATVTWAQGYTLLVGWCAVICIWAAKAATVLQHTCEPHDVVVVLPALPEHIYKLHDHVYMKDAVYVTLLTHKLVVQVGTTGDCFDNASLSLGGDCCQGQSVCCSCIGDNLTWTHLKRSTYASARRICCSAQQWQAMSTVHVV